MWFWILILALFVLTACEPSAEDNLLPTLMVLPVETPTNAPRIPTLLPLPYDQPVDGNLETGQADHWQFSARAGDRIALRALSDAVLARLELLAPDGEVLAAGSIIEADITVDGVHILRITALEGRGSYQLGLSLADQPSPAEPTLTPLPQIVGVPTPTPVHAGLGNFIGTLAHGSTVPSTFHFAEGPQVFTFMAEAGQYAHLTLDGVSGEAGLLMTLYTPQAVALAADSLSADGNGRLRSIPLQETGSYSVRVESNGQPATYTLTLTLSDAPISITPTYHITPTHAPVTPVLTPEHPAAQTGTRLSPDQPVSAVIDGASSVNMHSFAVRMGDIFTIGVRPAAESSLIPRVEIIDPDGAPVITISGTRSPTDRDVVASPLTAEMDGPYTVIVSGEGGTQGAYTVSYGSGSASEVIFRGEAPADTANIATMTRRGTADIWHIALRQGDMISAGVVPLDAGLVPVLELRADDGTLLGIDSQGAGPRSPLISGVRAPHTGLYLLKIRPAEAEAIGSYQLLWRYLDLGATPTPAPGTLPFLRVDGTLESEAYAFYPFHAEAGQIITVSVRAAAESALDPVAAIIGVDGSVIAEGDDSGASLDAYFEAVLPHSGTYQLRINGYLSSGAFQAAVTAIYP